MTLIQFLLLLLALLLFWYFSKHASLYSLRAWKRLAFCGLFVFMVVSVAVPELTNRLAHLVGVGRGADLLLYALAVSFLFIVINIYMKFQDQKNTMYKIARHIAVYEAQQRNQPVKKSPEK